MQKRTRIFVAVVACLSTLQLHIPVHASSASPDSSAMHLQLGSIEPTQVITVRPPVNEDLLRSPAVNVPTRARQVHQLSLRSGHDPHLFTLAGDSNSNPLSYLGRITAGAFDLNKYPGLRPVVTRYRPAFTHISLAVGGGFRAADMMDPAHATGFDECRRDEGLFGCELRTSNASVVFILLGTGDKFAWRDFEANYRAMVEYALRSNVLPVLVTKADDIESIQGGASDGYINGMIRRLADEYQMPLADLWAATRNLPVIPNPNLPHRPYTQNGLHDGWGLYFHLTDEGQDVHILLTLQVLDMLSR